MSAVLYVIFLVLLPAGGVVYGLLWLHRRHIGPRMEARAGRQEPTWLERLRDWAAARYQTWTGWRDRPRGDGPGGTGKWGDQDGPFEKPAPAPSRPAAAPVRPAPPLPEDDRVAAPSEIEGVMTAAIPPPWAALAAWIATFEPESDSDHVAFMQGNAAGFLAVGDAYRAYAETCLSSIGMDPAAVGGTTELADVVGETAHDVTLALRRFLVTYAAIREAMASGVVLPHNARQFFSSGEAA